MKDLKGLEPKQKIQFYHEKHEKTRKIIQLYHEEVKLLTPHSSLKKIMTTRPGNFLYYGIVDHICCCLLFLVGVVISFYFPFESNPDATVTLTVLFSGASVLMVIVIGYSIAALDNLFYLPLFLPAKLILAGLLVISGILVLSALSSATKQGQSGEQRIKAVGGATASGASSWGIYYLMKKCTKK